MSMVIGTAVKSIKARLVNIPTNMDKLKHGQKENKITLNHGATESLAA